MVEHEKNFYFLSANDKNIFLQEKIFVFSSNIFFKMNDNKNECIFDAKLPVLVAWWIIGLGIVIKSHLGREGRLYKHRFKDNARSVAAISLRTGKLQTKNEKYVKPLT